MAANIHVILARDVPHLGHLGEVVRVRPGFARNFLFPRQFALPVSTSRVKHFEHQKRIVEHQRQKLRTATEEIKKQLASVQVTVSGKAGPQGKLFGSIGSRDIEKAMLEQGYTVLHRDIKLESPIKTVGLHQVEVRLEGDVKAMVNVVVVPEVEEMVAQAAPMEADAEAAIEEDTDTEIA